MEETAHFKGNTNQWAQRWWCVWQKWYTAALKDHYTPCRQYIITKREEWKQSSGRQGGATGPSVLWLWMAIWRWKMTLASHILKYFRILLALLQTLKEICKSVFLKGVRWLIIWHNAVITLTAKPWCQSQSKRCHMFTWAYIEFDPSFCWFQHKVLQL